MQIASLAEKSIKFCCPASEGGLPVTLNIWTVFSELEHFCPQQSSATSQRGLLQNHKRGAEQDRPPS